MSSGQAGRSEAERERPRRLVPVGVVVAVYFVAGMLWVVGRGWVAEAVSGATSTARWVVELGLGVLFIAVTTLALSLSMRRRAERLDAAHERTQEADARTDHADARTDDANERTDVANERTDDANERTDVANARTDDANARTDDANARTHEANARADGTGRELAASEDRNRLQATALSGTTIAVVVTDRAGTIEWVNQAFETMTGYPASAAVGATPRLLKSGLHDEDFYRELWDTVLAGGVWRGQVVNRRSDGELYTVSQTITPVAVESGDVRQFVATLEDVTERVEAARDLEASRLRLESLLNHAIDAIVVVDEEGRYIEVNPAFCELTGYTRDELLGMGPADLIAPPRQPGDTAAQVEELVDLGAELGGLTLRRKDGGEVETEYRTVSNIQAGVHLSVLRDVTAHNRMLRALTVAEAEFRELATKAVDIVAKLRMDGDGRLKVDYINPAATTILGFAAECFYDDQNMLLSLFSGGSGGLGNVLQLLLPTRDEPTRLATVQAQRADGSMVWLEIHSALTDPASTPLTIQLVARDVTARSEMTQALEQALGDQLEAAQQLRRLNAMKDSFLQSVSHELRTPLTAIVGFAQLLADPRHGLSPGDTREFHKRISSNAERLRRLLDDLLDVDRFTRGDIEPNRTTTDLVDLIDRVIDDFDMGDHAVEFDLVPVTMDVDATWVERIVANLLRNVVRHPPPDARVWIRTRVTTEGVELIVDDDGPGIPEVDRQRVMEPFEQGQDAAASAQPGTGVGLSLVNAFAQLHGGGVVITESPAGGTRVIVTLAHAHTDRPLVAPAVPLGR